MGEGLTWPMGSCLAIAPFIAFDAVVAGVSKLPHFPPPPPWLPLPAPNLGGGAAQWDRAGVPVAEGEAARMAWHSVGDLAACTVHATGESWATHAGQVARARVRLSVLHAAVEGRAACTVHSARSEVRLCTVEVGALPMWCVDH